MSCVQVAMDNIQHAIMKDPTKYKVEALKEMLKRHNLSTAGTKNELICRLMEADPNGEWLREDNEESRDRRGDAEDVSQASVSRTQQGTSARLSEIELYEREREIARRELELARREIEMLRQNQRMERVAINENQNTNNDIVRTQSAQSKINVTAIADLLGYFDGKSVHYETWENQIRLLKTTYKLEDDTARLIIAMRLKGKALEWIHSKPEYVAMSFDALLGELRSMFQHRQSKMALRKKFEDRMWKKEETFHEYVHEKIITGNRVPINNDEMLEYIVEGIPDDALRNQARIQRFDTVEALLNAFEKVTLRERGAFNSAKFEKRNGVANREEKTEKGDAKRRPTDTVRHCHNCGMRDHLGANCPTKDQGAKCFACNERGHIASKCPKKAGTSKSCLTATRSRNQKYVKDVSIQGHQIKALIDSGSDLTLMRADEYVKLGSPRLKLGGMRFRGVGSDNNTTLGEFEAEIRVDEHNYSVCIQVVSDTLMRHQMLLGTNFLDAVEVNFKAGKISISPLQESTCENKHSIPEIFNINLTHADFEINHVDVTGAGNAEQRASLQNLIENYKPNKARETNIKMKLILKDEEPVYQSARRLSPSEREEVNAQIDEWLAEGIIQPSISEYASPVVLVRKKDGAARLCVDYRHLNKKILKDRYPLPLIEDEIDLLQGALLFTTLDLRNGFFHVAVEESSRKYTAFVVPDGHYEFLKVPFGLCNSPAVFQRFVNLIFRDLIREGIVMAYMDDLIIPSNDVDIGLKRLERVLKVASEAGLDINWKKCCFLQTRVEFLGHVIEAGQVRPSNKKTEAVRRFPEPTNVKQVQSFLGLSGYFRKFIPGYAAIAHPLSSLLKTGVKFNFGAAEKNAFERLKKMLSEGPVLSLYRAGAETELHTDASALGYGAILLQRGNEDNLFHPVYYSSGKTTSAEAKYPSYELEVLAIIKALKKFRVYLLGITFKIVTDCRAFTLTMNKKDLCVRVARWALLLEEFHYTIEHRPGKSMVHVDALSRNPLPACLVIDETDAGLTARLRRAQEEDDGVKRLRELVSRGQAQEYTLRGNLLFRESDGDLQLVVPRRMQAQIIRRAHEQGHFSVNKTESLVKNDYWIPNLRRRVEEIVRNCVACILAERKQGKQECFLHPIEKGKVPLDTLHMDHLGPLPSTKKTYHHILVVIDAFSKFVWLYATKSTSTHEVLTRLRKQAAVFCNPRRIVTDRGTAFTSSEFEEYCKVQNIEHILITTGVPRANGQVERVNRTLIPLLTKLAAPKPHEWYRHLDTAQQYLNAAPHRSLCLSPFQVLLGTHPRLKDCPEIKEILEKERLESFQDAREEL